MKKILLLLSLLLILVSCGDEKGETGNTAPDKVNKPVSQPAVLPEKPEFVPEEPEITEPESNDPVEYPTDNVPSIELPTEQIPTRTPEQESLDTELIMLLREQLDGAYPVAGASFTYIYNEELDGRECFVYEMQNDDVSETFAVATDSTAIYHLEKEGFVSIFNLN